MARAVLFRNTLGDLSSTPPEAPSIKNPEDLACADELPGRL
jgi:hypothetical protein